MKIRLSAEEMEEIETLLKMGVKEGEIQALFPKLSCSAIRRIEKELRLSTSVRKDKSLVVNRNTVAIKREIEKGIEYGTILRTPKVDSFLKLIDTLAPTPNGRIENITKAFRRERIEEEKSLRERLAVPSEQLDVRVRTKNRAKGKDTINKTINHEK